MYWGEFVLTAVYIMNRLPIAALAYNTPYTALFNTEVDYAYLKAFGSLVYAHNPKYNGDKLDSRGVACVFMGYAPFHNGYKVMYISIRELFVTRDIQFYEHIFPYNPTSSNFYLEPLPLALPLIQPVTSDDGFVSTDGDERIDEFSPVQSHSSPSVETDASFESDGANVSKHHTTNAPSIRTSRLSKPPVWLSNYKTNLPQASHISQIVSHMVQSDFGCFLDALTTSADPVHFSQVVQHSHWIAAMNTELEALEHNGT